MFASPSPRARRLLNSLAYSGLVAVVAALGYLTFHAARERRHRAESAAASSAESAATPLFELSNFVMRREKSSDAERLSISVRLRLTTPGAVDCYVYVLARNDHVSPKLWGVWPPQQAGGALTAGGHFQGNPPVTGQAERLTTGWTRITATIDHPLGRPAFEVATIYVVSPKGDVLLARPFVL